MSNRLRYNRLFFAVVLPSLLAVCTLAVTPAPGVAQDDEVTFKDPTRPPAKKVVALPVIEVAPVVEEIVETKRRKRAVRRGPPALQLSSVLVSNQRRRAVINGRLLQEGETVAGARVVEISLNGVTVQRAGRIQTLSLVSANVKRRSNGAPLEQFSE